jgi:hypothetical protein
VTEYLPTLVLGWALVLALLANAVATVLHALELRRARRGRPRPAAGDVVGTPPQPRSTTRRPDVEEEAWLKDQRQRILAKLRLDFPKRSGHNLDAAADEILEKARSVLARIQ